MNDRNKSPKKSDVGRVRIEKDDKRFLEQVSQEFGGESMSKVLTGQLMLSADSGISLVLGQVRKR